MQLNLQLITCCHWNYGNLLTTLTVNSFKLIYMGTRVESENLSNETLERGLCYPCKTETLCSPIRDKVEKVKDLA